MFNIKNGQLVMYNINEDYKNYLRQFDKKVSLKENRKFYGILVSKNNIDYYVPFTSKVDKKTSNKLTVNIKDKGKTIAKLLLNNMIPVNCEDAYIVNINKEKYKDYYLKEIAYLRSQDVIEEILRKIDNIYTIINEPEHKDYYFFNKLCCDFTLLEEKCKEWNNYVILSEINEEESAEDEDEDEL